MIRRAAAEDLELPIPRLLRRMNDKSLPENYRDSLAIAAASYFHAKLSSTAAKVQFLSPEEMSDQQLAEWIDRAKAAVQREQDLATSKRSCEKPTIRQVLLDSLLTTLERERERRQAAEKAKAEEAADKLLTELEEMGRRMLAGRVPGRDLQDDMELVEQLARAENWARVDELRIPVDMSPMEAVAAAMTVDPKAAIGCSANYPG